MNGLVFHFRHTKGLEIGIDNLFSFQLLPKMLVESFLFASQWSATKNRNQPGGKLND